MIVIVLIGLITFIALSASCLDEAQLRNALYGELGPEYKRALEWIGVGSKFFHGPHLVYHNHVIYSTLDWHESNGSEVRLASGRAGKIQLTPEAKEVKGLILSVPGIDFILPKKQR